MKKLITIMLAMTCLATGMHAQGFFSQSSSQRKRLLEQIAALQVYIGYAKKGYSVAKQGLNTISNIKHGELNLHAGHYDGLKNVSPAVKGYSKIASTVALQTRIAKVYRDATAQLRNSGAFSPDETAYINGVYGRLMEACDRTIDELIDVTTNNRLEMKDDERLQRIDQIHADMQGNYTFVQAFSNSAKLLAASRIRERKEIETSRAINGIKK